jgi:2-polyprenyl-3-methyl-5-hydroxy-6-metoxy-1,4-benzoquinol methylase
MGKFNLKEYNDRYYKWHYDNTRNYIIKTMDWYMDTYKPNSVIDYGCGIGSYLESAMNKGVEKIKGFDIGGEYVKKYTNKNVIPFIEYLDCTKPLITDKYDCTISLETGEHIETELSESFVKNITDSTSDKGIILYSAAQPNQNGTGHINCQTKEFWIKIFEKNNFQKEIELTKHISDNWFRLGAPNYICNNLIVFKKKI